MAPEELALHLGGELLAPGVILIERRVELPAAHGGYALSTLAQGPVAYPEAEVDPAGMIFLDTETTGLAGGSGTTVFLLGLGRVEGRDLVIRQYFLSAFSGEATLLDAAGEWLNGAEGMVTYNGKRFDLPLLTTRCRLAGVRDRFVELPHLDLLYPTRRAFSSRWEDCRLVTAEQRLLRFFRENDLPGSEAPESWFSFIHFGDAARLPAVAKHNYWDILSLAALLPALSAVHDEPGAWEADILAVARAHQREGDEAKGFALLRRHRAVLDAEGLMELAALYRRGEEWSQACLIWEMLAERDHMEAVERLAKYHEHVRRDFASALRYAERLPPGPHHDRRRERLRERSSGRPAGRTPERNL